MANLSLLSGETIKEGWYDFTQLEEGGNGARYITNDSGRIVGAELNFTANMFGDKEPGDDFITDPGATVGTETRWNNEEGEEVAIAEVELQVLRDSVHKSSRLKFLLSQVWVLTDQVIVLQIHNLQAKVMVTKFLL